MTRHFSILLAGAAVVLLAVPSEAVLIQYSSKALFLADTGATSATGPLPNIGNAGLTETVGAVTFDSLSSTLFFGTLGTGVGAQWSTVLPGNELAISGPESFEIAVPGPIYSLGFDFIEPNVSDVATDGCNAPCFDSTFEVTLLSGGVAIPGASFSFNGPDATAWFVGVWTDFAFDGARIVDSTGTIDNEFWGEFYTGTESAVPEPGTLLLLGGGLLGLAARRRRAS
jgi:PEP-CTERM motif